MTRARLFGFWPYAAAGVVVAVTSVASILLLRESAPDLYASAAALAETVWRKALGPGGMLLIGTILLLLIEPFFLAWEKTTLFVVFVRRRVSAMVDLGATVFFFSTFKTVVEYFFTFGIAYAIAKLTDAAAAHFGWMRWELPSQGMLQITAGFAIYYLLSSFIGYWQHRLMHWRWFWQLHRFHHAATEFNILTTFRVNPAEAITVIPAVLPLFFIKTPDASLFASFVVINSLLASLQHSALPWTLGWFGRWVISSPTNHQFHHSIDPEHRDKNFSGCPLWDHMFGTWCDGPNPPSGYGIADPAHVERPLTQWLIDVWIFYRDVVQWAWTRIRRRQVAADAAPNTTVSIPAE
jgi:sterol desaturase/sphingolipid hydroxylase (fatty acid hydroxylase superfamily)